MTIIQVEKDIDCSERILRRLKIEPLFPLKFKSILNMAKLYDINFHISKAIEKSFAIKNITCKNLNLTLLVLWVLNHFSAHFIIEANVL